MRHIYMVRHGQSLANANKIVAGSQESPLTALGKHQAMLAAKKVAPLQIDLIVCSPMIRALATAKIIAEQIGYPATDIQTMPELIERTLGNLEGKTYAHNEKMNGNYIEAEDVPNIEDINTLYHRTKFALQEILAKKQHTHILVVCHMNIGRMLWVIAKGLPPLAMYDQPRLENARLYKLF